MLGTKNFARGLCCRIVYPAPSRCTYAALLRLSPLLRRRRRRRRKTSTLGARPDGRTDDRPGGRPQPCLLASLTNEGAGFLNAFKLASAPDLSDRRFQETGTRREGKQSKVARSLCSCSRENELANEGERRREGEREERGREGGERGREGRPPQQRKAGGDRRGPSLPHPPSVWRSRFLGRER